jgi:DNA polymerase-3 subunit alpha
VASQFVHLHLHTQYSLLDGANQIDPLMQQVKSFGQPAVAMTDHGNMFGAVEFYRKAKEAGVKPIIGCEAYMAPGSRLEKNSHLAHNDYYHLILLATNLKGYQNLIKLVSKAYLEGFYYKPRMDKEILQQHHEGLIGLSGCLSGEVAYLIGQKDLAGATKAAGEYREIFGKDNYYLELQANGLEHQRIANDGLLEIHKKLDIPLAGTNDCHYLKAEDSRPHDLMLCLQTGKTINDPNRMKFDTDQLYVKSTDQALREFKEMPTAVSNTVKIAEACTLDLAFNKTYLPQFKVPEGFTRESYVEQLALEGLAARLKERPSSIPEIAYQVRLKEEVAVICSMGFAGYFLIVWDIIKFARSRGIPVGPGRGSAAGSLVAYALRITDLDPLVYSLLFERFLNPERVSLPDIDMDFCMDRRDEVINYVIHKYGEDHVAQIITFGTMKAKAAIRDVGRVLEMPYAEVDRIAKLVPDDLKMTLDKALEQEPRLKELVDKDVKVKELMSVAQSLEGLARHASTHAAGIVISDQPLTEHVPLYKGPKDEIVTQYSMGDVEKIGLVKFDFLGLKTLTMIHRAETLVNEVRPGQPPLLVEQLPFDDPETFALLSSGKTTGVFQLESSGMRDLLMGLKPDRFEDIIAIIALYRPGPMDLIPDFIKRKQGKIPIAYEMPELEPILKDTYGVIVYQEQVMAIANKVAGFSLGQADILRRAMGKKKPEEMEKLRVQFLEGAKQKKISEKKADKLYELIQKFAGYGFNKSHAAAYAVVCYQTAYLKAHYPTEFMAALMTTDMGNADKIVGYFTECRGLGIPVLPPDVNQSQKNFAVVDKSIRFGLAAIKNVGEGAVEAIIEVRNEDRPVPLLLRPLPPGRSPQVEQTHDGRVDQSGGLRFHGRTALAISGRARPGHGRRDEHSERARARPDQHLRRRHHRYAAATGRAGPARRARVEPGRAVEIRAGVDRLLHQRPSAGPLRSRHPTLRQHHDHADPRCAGRTRGQTLRDHHGGEIHAHQKRRPHGLHHAGGFTWAGRSDSLPRPVSRPCRHDRAGTGRAIDGHRGSRRQGHQVARDQDRTAG